MTIIDARGNELTMGCLESKISRFSYLVVKVMDFKYKIPWLKTHCRLYRYPANSQRIYNVWFQAICDLTWWLCNLEVDMGQDKESQIPSVTKTYQQVPIMILKCHKKWSWSENKHSLC